MSVHELETSIYQKMQNWLHGAYDEKTKQEIRSLLSDRNFTTLTDAFYKDLEFGTGGMRGIMGVGTNRVNKYTLGKATQGLSNYLKATFPGEKVSVLIAHDNRNKSDVFARQTAEIFSANGIHVYFFEGLRPTPELSFAIRELKCHSGVMITASHNPKEYNGYKVYGRDGGQLVAPHDNAVLAEVHKIKKMEDIRFDYDEKRIEVIGEDIDQKYYNALCKLSISKASIQRQKDMKIVYSPIHGAGGVAVPPVLLKFGFENVILVEKQMAYDGDFPTVIYPNPEEKEALALSLKKAMEVDADLVLATDPDADRVGVAVKNEHGDFVLLNGNQTASLLIHYMLNAWKDSGKLKGNEYVVKTIVTSYMIDKIAASMGVACFNTLTGFKYIGELITRLEGERTFIAGGEESYGYLVGEHARDKDAVISCAMIAEMAAWCKDQGSSLSEALTQLYLEYGFYKEKLVSITKKGKRGAEDIAKMMEDFRKAPPIYLSGSKVLEIKDYLYSTSTNTLDDGISKIDFPKSNVLQFITEDGSIVSARPSGTEPKIKFYCSVHTKLHSKEDFDATEAKLDKKLDMILSDLGV